LAAVARVALLLGTTSVVNAASSSTSAAAANQNGSNMKVEAVTSLPVSFEVENVNRSKVACASDGATYTVRGHIVGPTKEFYGGGIFHMRKVGALRFVRVTDYPILAPLIEGGP
jgi:hypothetical protein